MELTSYYFGYKIRGYTVRIFVTNSHMALYFKSHYILIIAHFILIPFNYLFKEVVDATQLRDLLLSVCKGCIDATTGASNLLHFGAKEGHIVF